jgi:hypothetical protein
MRRKVEGGTELVTRRRSRRCTVLVLLVLAGACATVTKYGPRGPDGGGGGGEARLSRGPRGDVHPWPIETAKIRVARGVVPDGAVDARESIRLLQAQGG